MGMLVLTVDVGGRPEAAGHGERIRCGRLAAAQSCADTGDSFTPESRADIYAAANVDGLLPRTAVSPRSSGATPAVGT
jgi:hypothetical protein